jgi:hypothetical protein
MEAASILTTLVRSVSYLESKTGEKEAREAEFSIREEKTNWSWRPDLAKYVKKRQNCVKTDRMADKTIVTVAQAALVLVATKQLKENG